MANNLNENSKFTVKHQPFATLAPAWTGRPEPHETDRARYWYQLVNGYHQGQGAHKYGNTQKIGLVGFACDQGVRRNLGRVGAKAGPLSIRQAFAKLPLSQRLQNNYNSADLALLLGDAGDIMCHDNDTLTPDALEQTQALYSQQIERIIHQDSLAIGLGGGHAIAYASYMGLWQALNRAADDLDVKHTETRQTKASSVPSRLPKIGIINFDAHLDIRSAPTGTSGTPFRQIAEHNHAHNQPFYYCAIGISQFSNTAALFDRAESLGVSIISDDACYRKSWTQIAKQLDDFMALVDVLYVTIDMDAFAASVVPGVSAPAAKGISLDFAEHCLAHIYGSHKVKLADIAEINPTYDLDGRSCKAAARLLALMVEHYLLR